MNRHINNLIGFFAARPFGSLILIVVLLAVIVYGYQSCRSGYVDKKSEQHDQRAEGRTERERQLEIEVTRLRAEADLLVKEQATKDAQIEAYKKLAAEKTGLDRQEAQKIDDITKAYEREAAATDAPVDAATRFARLCAKYAERGIKLDCSR